MLNEGWTYTDHVTAADRGRTALDFYACRYPHSAPHLWRERLEQGLATIDGRVADPEAVLEPGQVLQYHRPPWREPEVPTDVTVAYEDQDLLAVVKPSGLAVLPGGEFLKNTLLTIVTGLYPGVAPVHRLGRGTSGLVLFARSGRARRALAAALRERRLGKTYRALVEGLPATSDFRIEQPIGRLFHPRLTHVYGAAADGADSISDGRVLHRDKVSCRSLVEIGIQTGRPHQIRIHMAAFGHPLVGDPLYGVGGRPTRKAIDDRVVPGDGGYQLHAMRLELGHPADGRPLTIQAPPPPILALPGECPDCRRQGGNGR